MNSNGILHTTVNSKGRMRIWDGPGEAIAGKDKDETVLQLSLTKHQMTLVLRAAQLSRDKVTPQSGT